MTPDEYWFTASEISELEGLLSEMAGAEYAIERIGLERRLEKARKCIAGIAPPAVAVYDGAVTESTSGPSLDPNMNGGDPGERSKAV